MEISSSSESVKRMEKCCINRKRRKFYRDCNELVTYKWPRRKLYLCAILQIVDTKTGKTEILEFNNQFASNACKRKIIKTSNLDESVPPAVVTIKEDVFDNIEDIDFSDVDSDQGYPKPRILVRVPQLEL